MKKRLRKKLCLGEFQNWVFEIRFKYDSALVDPNSIWDGLDELMGEDMFCGGGGLAGAEEILVGFYSWPDEAKREAARVRFKLWLESQPELEASEVGPLQVDLSKAQHCAPRAALHQEFINRRQRIPMFPRID